MMIFCVYIQQNLRKSVKFEWNNNKNTIRLPDLRFVFIFDHKSLTV
jgi:hypothetical protein